MRFPFRIFILPVIIIFLSVTGASAAIFYKTFGTKYTTVHYLEDRDMDDFLWRLGGDRVSFPAEGTIASNRVDRIVERVETILDMRPKNFKVNIYLKRGALEPNRIAFYDNGSKSIHISVDFATDGVLAHEIAHAVIDRYFPTAAPTKVQEILTQYVDKYLWSDY